MGKKLSKKITYPGFLHLHRPLLECSDFRTLKGNALKLLIDLGAQYTGYNNGDLCAAMSVLRRRAWNSNDQINKAIEVLQERNLIIKTKQGGLGIGPNLYALTWFPINECGGKLDVKPSDHPMRSFK